MSDVNRSRIESLRQARSRQPWTVNFVVACAADPSSFKARTAACTACPEPCESNEVCATALAKSKGLLDAMGRDQAYHLVENGMKRLRTQGEATLRTTDRERPNTFLRLDEIPNDELASNDERQSENI